MMNAIHWARGYETGVEDIDLQHHYFLNLVNTVSDAIQERQGTEYLEALVSELSAYARFHFKSEERMMLHSGYPEYEAHKNLHFDLIQQLGVEQYKLTNPTHAEDAQAVIDFLLRWFIEHTTTEDRRFATYLLKQRNG